MRKAVVILPEEKSIADRRASSGASPVWLCRYQQSGFDLEQIQSH